MKFVYRILLAAISAILLALAFSTLNLSFLIWIGLVPLFFAIEGQDSRQAFCISYLCGLLFFLSSMYWLIFVTPCGWIILSLYQAIYFGFFGLLCKYLPTPYTLHPKPYFFIPSAWCLLEYLRSHIGGGIGWNLLGYAEYQNIPLIQIADIIGVYGVSFIIVLVNFAVFSVIKMGIKCQRTHKTIFAKSKLPLKEEIKINPLFQTLAVFFIVIAVLAYGYKKIGALDIRDASSEEVKVSVIQGNIPQLHKWDPSYKDYIMKKYEKLTIEAAKDNSQLIIWPETSAPGYLNKESELYEYVMDMAKISTGSLLVGAPMIALIGDEDIGDYNSALLFSKEARLLQQYNKLHLVVLGEFIPFEKYLPFLRSFLPLTGEFIPGNEYTVFQLSLGKLGANFGTLICFEDIFPNMVRRFVKEGADFMVNMTNDAWFGRTTAAYQHAANSVFRAIENRRPFVRSANTGLSCFIDTAGRIYATVSSNGQELFIDGYKTDIVKIASDSPLTFYTRFGDIFIIFCSFITALFLIDYLRRQRYNK